MLDFTKPKCKCICILKNYVPKEVKTEGNCYLSTVMILILPECIDYILTKTLLLMRRCCQYNVLDFNI